MRKLLFIMTFGFFGASAFCLPTVESSDGEIFFISEPSGTSAPKGKKSVQKPIDEIDLLLEVKTGYYWFGSSKMRHVYKNGGIDIQWAVSGKIWKMLHAYGAVEYIEKSGSSLNGDQTTKIRMIPLSFGLKPTFNVIEGLDGYFNIGPRYFIIHQHNHSSYVNSSLNENGLGGFVGAGFYIHLNKHLTLDGYAEYSYFERQFSSFHPNVKGHKVNFGGAAFGGGLGYSF